MKSTPAFSFNVKLHIDHQYPNFTKDESDMADRRMKGLRNHSRSTSSKPHKSAHPRHLHSRVPQASSNAYKTLDNDSEDFSGYTIGPNCWRGSSSNVSSSKAKVSVDVAGGQLTATSVEFSTRAENGSLTPYPSTDTHAVLSSSIPATTHKEGNANTTTGVSDVWYRSYQPGLPLTSAYMDSTSISSNADPYGQLNPHTQSYSSTLDRYRTLVTYSPLALDIVGNHGDTTWTDNVSSQFQGPYTHYEGTQPEFNDSGDPPYARRWSIQNNQGSTASDSASQATQDDDETRRHENMKGFEENEFQRNVIGVFMNGEKPWAYGYNMSSGQGSPMNRYPFVRGE
ncbi:hypothetical protein F4813DRAFT_395680 [Daldinia decipiens]|uniref:uncharacterized protein n=1 Tax=Daldinia decipiens TaxID=326647 RepID=UPI0020C312A2|nr:uncharacterized protein F4813DRAFT_395680 [Daldinia decipiens]KAI1658807.1 hypothetical protein F4813DRAFT_395680 [Daldinia decipiens]